MLAPAEKRGVKSSLQSDKYPAIITYMMKLSIIILSYNTKEVTERCLTSLLKSLPHTKKLESEVIVVDNGSTDGSGEMLQRHKAHRVLKVIKNNNNLGFAQANNQAIKVAKGQYILFLNSDVILNKINFIRLVNYLDTKKEVGVLTVKVQLPSGDIDPASHRGFPTVWNSFCYFFKLEKLLGRFPFIGRLFGGYHLAYLDLATAHEIDSPSGAFYLTRKKILDEVDGFDEQFFMYGEDLDLSYRIKEAGYKVLYYPLFSVTHLKYVSGLATVDEKVKNKIKKHFYQAMKIFYKKHYQDKNPQFLNQLIYFFIDLKNKFS
jgi:GT2 family glycosyltransferase